MQDLSETTRWIFGGAATAILGAFTWLTTTASAGRAKLHARIDAHVAEDAKAHATFATRDDIASLRAHIDHRFGELTQILTARRGRGGD